MKMQATYLILASLLAVSASADIVSTIKDNFAKIPAEFNNLMPNEISDYIKSLTPEEGTAMQEAAKKYKDFKNEQDYSDFIKKQSPELHKKSAKLQETMKGKLGNLNDDAKSYIEKAHAEAQRIHSRYIGGDIPTMDELKEMAKNQMEKYHQLSLEAKDSIASHFPSFHEMAISKIPDPNAFTDSVKDSVKNVLSEAKDIVYGTIKDEI